MEVIHIDQETLHLARSLGWFLAGVISYRAVAAVVGYVQVSAFAMEINDILLTILGKMAEDILFVKELKYKTMREAGYSEDKIESVRSYDVFFFENWKQSVMSNFLTSYPKRFYFLLNFKNWNEAMDHLTKIYKNG